MLFLGCWYVLWQLVLFCYLLTYYKIVYIYLHIHIYLYCIHAICVLDKRVSAFDPLRITYVIDFNINLIMSDVKF